jgi:peptidyl-tRNA hydrolase, PTH1 family
MGGDIFIIAGLGNPGEKYNGTRHNAGFMVVDALARKYDCLVNLEKWEAVSARVSLFGRKVCLVKPMIYMNLSGKAVVRFVDFYKIPLQNLLVIHDDLDMKPGRVKMTLGGGHGGHNGIRSLMQYLGGKDFFRLKIGIGRPGQDALHPEIPVEDYVLSRFLPAEKDLLADRIEPLIQGIGYFLHNDVSRAMNLLNSLK